MFLRPKYCLENGENSISKHLNFKIFWGWGNARKAGCRLLAQWGHLLQNLLTPLTSLNTMWDSRNGAVWRKHCIAIPPWPWKCIHLSGWHDRAGKHVAGLDFSLHLFLVVLGVDLTEGESRMEWCLVGPLLTAILFTELTDLDDKMLL